MTDPGALFERALRSFQSIAGTHQQHFSLGERVIRVTFAGEGLMPLLMPALEHLRTGPSQVEPDLQIMVWDSATTGAVMPAPPWSKADYLPRGEVRGYSNHRFFTSFSPGTHVLIMLDRQRRLALYWIRSPEFLPLAEIGAPFLHLLNHWASANGDVILHAAAIGLPNAGVILAGRGGAGKSSTALAAVAGGMLYLADDYCLVRSMPRPQISSLYNSAKLNLDMTERLGRFRPDRASELENGMPKNLYFLQRACPEQVARDLPLRAILLPHVGRGGELHLTPASPAEAMRALAPSTLFQLAGSEGSTLRLIAGLVKRIPCYHLTLSDDLEAIPRVLEGFLDQWSHERPQN